jgi:hypothetical protein
MSSSSDKESGEQGISKRRKGFMSEKKCKHSVVLNDEVNGLP